MSEAELQRAVIETARLLGWKIAHFRPGMTQAGNWVTAVQGDGKGFPDLVLVKPGRLLFAELKADGKYLAPAQREWQAALEEAGQVFKVWRPDDWVQGRVERELRA